MKNLFPIVPEEVDDLENNGKCISICILYRIDRQATKAKKKNDEGWIKTVKSRGKDGGNKGVPDHTTKIRYRAGSQPRIYMHR